MKKKFVALLMSAAMVSGSLVLPVYAAEEETVIEFADDEEDTVDVEEEPEESEEQGYRKYQRIPGRIFLISRLQKIFHQKVKQSVPARLLVEILTGEAPMQPCQRM